MQGLGAEQCLSHAHIDVIFVPFCVHSISLKKYCRFLAIMVAFSTRGGKKTSFLSCEFHSYPLLKWLK